MSEDVAMLDRGAAVMAADYLAVRKGEAVLITADAQTDARALRAVFRALTALEAVPSILTIPTVPFQGALADPYVPRFVEPAVLAADVWIDLCFPYLAGSHVYEVAIKAGKTRYLLGADLGAEGIGRLFGAMDLDGHYAVHEKMEELIIGSVGKRARITCPRGTDVLFEIDKPPYRKPRRAEKPGHYLVPGSATLFPVLESVRGTIAFTAIFHEYYAAVEPALIVKVDGKIREVQGPTTHRLTLDRALRRAGNGQYGNIIHFTHGMSPTARATGRSFIEDSRVMGVDAVGMGLPWWIPGGGENHPDGVISDQSLWIDGEQIVKDGAIVAPSIAPITHRLAPRVPPPL